MLGIHALQASLSLLLEVGLDDVEKAVLERARYLMNAFSESPDLELVTPAEPGRHAGIVTVRHHRRSESELFALLQKNGIFCARRGGGIRLSPHFYTPFEQLDCVVELLASARMR
jgi:selenocysteine lyase/cysteine desulfurase